MKKQTVELLRIVSAFGIVWYHASNIGKEIAYSGLVCFLVLSIYYSALPGGVRKPLTDRVQRILVPWVVWFLFYGTLNVVFNKPFIPTGNGYVAAFLTGTTTHLWYLPFIFFLAVFFGELKFFLSSRVLASLSFIAVVAVFMCTAYWRPWSLTLGYPWVQYAHAAAGVLFGVMLAQSTVLPMILRAGMIVAVFTTVLVFSMSFPSVGVTYLIGMSAVALALVPGKDFLRRFDFTEFSGCTMGIYLSHVFWVVGFRKMGMFSDITLPLTSFAISLLTVWVFRRLVPGIAKYVV